jgi:hypothetical protein
MKYKKGDCEDGACLLASILIHNKIPSWKVRVSAGWVTNPFNNKKEGHAYCIYYCLESDKWLILNKYNIFCMGMQGLFVKNTMNIVGKYKKEKDLDGPQS